MEDAKTPGFHWSWVGAPCLAAALLFLRVTPYMWAASVAYGMQATGFLLRRRFRVQHAILMGAGMALDVALVLILEVKRDAVATAMAFSLSPLQQAHVAVSTLAVLHYLPLTILGLSRLRDPSGPASRLTWHRRLGISAFVLRSLGFLLMFSMLGRHG